MGFLRLRLYEYCIGTALTMKLIWHSYLVLILGNCVHETPTETVLEQQQLVNYFWESDEKVKQGLHSV